MNLLLSAASESYQVKSATTLGVSHSVVTAG
jgi:hypothetical protein